MQFHITTRLNIIVQAPTFFVAHKIFVHVHQRSHRAIGHNLLLNLCDVCPRRHVNDRSYSKTKSYVQKLFHVTSA
jgi:hypothetical protein